LRRRGGRLRLVLLASALAASLPVLAQESDKKPKNRLRLEAEKVDIQKKESIVVLLGEAHIQLEGVADRGHGQKAAQFLDVRADDAVAFVPSESDLRNNGAAPIRQLYAEGHVRLSQKIEGQRPFLLEAEKLWLDLVGEKAYAVNATARLPGSQRPPTAVTTPNPQNTPLRQATFTLQARKLHLQGTTVLEGEDASLSACDFGLPHEALEAAKITIVQAGTRRKPITALTAAAGLGDTGGTAIAGRAIRDLPYRSLSHDLRDPGHAHEGSDAVYNVAQDPRMVHVEDPSLRVRPPFLGEEGVSAPFPIPLAWESDWPFPNVRVGQSSRFGWFELAEIKVPIWRPDMLYDNDDRRVRDGLEVNATAGGGFYENRGGTGNGGVTYQYTDLGIPVAKGQIAGEYIHDRAEFDRNGSIVPTEDRYWVRGVHQQDLPLGIHLDAEFSRQSDRDYLLEWERGVAFNQKPQETYVYLRDQWDDLGARVDASARLNDFQSQVEDMPRGRLDWILQPIVTRPDLGGLYFTSGVELAQLRRRYDDFLSVTPLPDRRLAREDLVGELDYKLSILDKVYFRAYGSGEYTNWSETQLANGVDHDSIDRFVGTVGARAGTQFDAPFVLSDTGLTLRHVVIPEAGYENRILDTRDPATIVQIDNVDTYGPGSYVYARLRNRFQIADTPTGKNARDLIDITTELRYFPTNERLVPQQEKWGTIYSDGRLYLGTDGIVRCVSEVDPDRHRLLRLDATGTFFLSRSIQKWMDEQEKIYPDVYLSLGYHVLADLSQAVSWGFEVRLTPSWGVSVAELYDFQQHSFLTHQVILRRYFHNFAVEGTFSYNQILHDTAFTFSILPFFEGADAAVNPRLSALGY
jgi:hypothetical protein